MRSAALLLVLLSGCASPRAQPDVVVVLIDTLRADALGCYGQPLPTTPWLDSLSRRSRLYEDVTAPAPWTKPSLASLFTGLPVREHGVRRGLGHVVGRDAPPPDDSAPSPPGSPPRTDGLPADLPTIASSFARASYETVALQANPHCKGSLGFAHGFHDYRDRTMEPARSLVREGLDVLTAPRGNPLFLFIHAIDPHASYAPQLSAFAPPPSQLAEITPLQLFRPPADPEFSARARLTYLTEVTEVDRAMGLLVRGTRGRDATLLVTADHGEELSDHGAFEHGHTLYEELLRVPLLLTPPAGALDPSPISLTDVLPILTANTPHRHPLVSEGLLYGPDKVSIRMGRWKLVDKLPGPTPDQLFDLEADPAERDPLPVTRGEAAALQAALLDLRAKQKPGQAASREIDPETKKALESIGYLSP